MAKSKTVSKTVQSSTLSKRRTNQETPTVFTKYENYIYIGIIILAVFIFFREGLFGGKLFYSSDILAFDSFRTFLNDAKASGVFPLWVPYVFMGMPNFPIIGYSPRVHDFFFYIWDSVFGTVTNYDTNYVLPIVMYYVIFAIGFYLYANYKFKNKLIALYCALAGVFATDYIQRIVVGHNTKVIALAFFPYVLLLVDKLIDSFSDKTRSLFNYKNLIYLFLLTICLHIQLNSNHIQMIFYSYLMIGIYMLYLIIYSLIKKINFGGYIKAGIVLAVASLISLAMNADVIMTIKNYNKYSMRGQASIESKLENKASDDQPLDYEYATNWSFSPGEVITFLLPYYYGFGDVEINGQRANLYWGQMPFTTNPMYFGVVTLVLFIIGVIFNFRRNPYVQAMTVVAFIFLLLSFGRNFSVLFDLFFNYFPFFSSFRAPVMIHHFMDLAIVVVAGFGLKSIIDIVKDHLATEKFKKLCYVLLGIAGLMFIISIIGFQDSYTSSVMSSSLAEKFKQQGASPQQINQYIKQNIIPTAYENSISDLRLHAFFIILVVGLALMYASGKVTMRVFLYGTIFIALIDIWNVNSKTIHWDDESEVKNAFPETDYTNWLLKTNPDTYTYRVAEFSNGRLATSNTMAHYRLHAFNGYHGAKIRNYQDVIDVAGGENPLLLSLGGVKYIISDKPIQDTSFVQVFKGSKQIYENKNFIPLAFFVDEYKVEKDITILNDIQQMNFDPRKTAYLEKELSQKIDKPDSTAAVKLTKGETMELEYEVNATGNNLLVFSQIYLPFGWKAYIDGNETEFYKTDYFLRSVVVPAGKHTVSFKYAPDTFYTGKNISMGANVVLGLILVAGIFGYAGSRKKTSTPPQAA